MIKKIKRHVKKFPRVVAGTIAIAVGTTAVAVFFLPGGGLALGFLLPQEMKAVAKKKALQHARAIGNLVRSLRPHKARHHR
ncbi:MAG: hypothetical protein A2946_02535 [Candidatus Liptonbacteria bacterium RIFCSPLOWO2_01_FULL_53_13]|uniref:Uncharacterized protein n=1 Tax=Candidatus Liptonbacteria bacterium RIFCSPLOWO2_01_FULL_53_13 TaxID=1798651 RepID=A0A1G2CM86_9BACT|nr:MAG: hypothetical protein A2946_02535 [Candidatus Liptonbacteria bacterium RIFCSPLOWO2_01_FULL_53_13]